MIIAVPSPINLTIPFSSTVATLSLSDVQITVGSAGFVTNTAIKSTGSLSAGASILLTSLPAVPSAFSYLMLRELPPPPPPPPPP